MLSRTTFFIVPIVVFAAIGGVGFYFHPAGDTQTVYMEPDGYIPRDLTISEGTKVVFTNNGTESRWPASNIHPTHELYPEFDPKRLVKAGAAWSFVFRKTGVWKYHDHLSPEISGTIIVVPRSSDSSGILNFSFSFPRLFAMKEKMKLVPVEENSDSIFTDKAALRSYVKKFGPKKTVERLHGGSSEYGDCHENAHLTGRFAYEFLGDKAFKACSHECHSGCYHGATEAFFKDHGTANLAKDLKTICSSELNPFFSHQCIHGIGHGLMAWSNYEIFDALKSCDLLEQQQDSCWTGVFMENIIGGLSNSKGHFTKYLNDDPLYPCTAVEDKYKNACYFMQTSRMVKLFSGDFQKIAQACGQAPEAYRSPCFQSMGRDVGGRWRGNPKEEIKSCGYVSSALYRIDCLSGAVQDAFWDPSGQDSALDFCRLLTRTEEKDSCYATIFSRAPQVLFKQDEREAFCVKAEPAYQNTCRAYTQ